MKRIKTLSAISLFTTLVGLSMPLLMPMSTVNAADMGQMKTGGEIPLDVPTPNETDFDNENTNVTVNDTMGNKAWPTPTYKAADRTWHFYNGEGAIYGSAAAAFKRAVNIDKDFTIEATSNISSADNWRFGTDSIGIVLSTANSDNLANEQTDGQKSKAGYANDKVQWQTVLGIQAFDSWTDPIKFLGVTVTPGTQPHHDFVRRTISGVQRQVAVKDYESNSLKAKPLSTDYKITFNATTRQLTYTTSSGITASDVLPGYVKELYIGFLVHILGNGMTNDSTSMTLTKMNASYVPTHTMVNYINEDDPSHPLATSTRIDGIVGQRLSVSGNVDDKTDYYWTTPKIGAAKLKDEASDRAERTILTEAADDDDNTTNVINVRYDAPKGTLPYRIFDDDDPHSKANLDGKIPLSIGSSYSYTLSNIGDAVAIPDGTHVVSLSHASGKVTADENNQVTNNPVEIHVKHTPVSTSATFNRRVKFVGPDGMQGLPNDDSQSPNIKVTKDGFDGHIIDAEDNFKPVDVPDMENSGFGIISVKDSAGNDLSDHLSNKQFTWDNVVNDSRPDAEVTITYAPEMKVEAPTFDFGTIDVGSKQFYGTAPQLATNISGGLKVVNGVRLSADWKLWAQLDNKNMPGDPSIILFKGDPHNEATITQKKSLVITKDIAGEKGPVWNIMSDVLNQQHMYDKYVALQFKNLQNENLNIPSGSASYQGDITWNLEVAPQ